MRADAAASEDEEDAAAFFDRSPIVGARSGARASSSQASSCASSSGMDGRRGAACKVVFNLCQMQTSACLSSCCFVGERSTAGADARV